MPDYNYSDVERAFIEAAEGRYTSAEVAAKLGRPESAVYQMARRMGVTLKPKTYGSLDLASRGAFVIPKGELERYQEYVIRIAEGYGLHSKSQVFLQALEVVARWLADEENTDDVVRADQQENSEEGL